MHSRPGKVHETAYHLLRVPIYVGDSFRSSPKKPEVLFRLRIDGIESSSQLRASLRGKLLQAGRNDTGEVRWAVPVEWVTSGYNLFELEWPARRTTEILDIKLQADSLRQFIKCCPERPASIDRGDVSFTIRTLPDRVQICTVDVHVVD